MRTTKTVWVNPSRDDYTGGCLLDDDYLNFVKDLIAKGFEIQSHSVGSGKFTREEIISGYEKFKELLGYYPKIHINHGRNPDNIYWGEHRFAPPLSWFIRLLKGPSIFSGEEKESSYFWGDWCKKHVKYIRGIVFNGICTNSYDKKMPYRVKSKDKYSNYWFSSSDGHTLNEFTHLISEKNIEKLEREGGFCIAYTHFGLDFTDENGKVNTEFEGAVKKLSQRNGWFVPASTLLDFILENKRSNDFASPAFLAKLNLLWLRDRIIKKIRFGI